MGQMQELFIELRAHLRLNIMRFLNWLEMHEEPWPSLSEHPRCFTTVGKVQNEQNLHQTHHFLSFGVYQQQHCLLHIKIVSIKVGEEPLTRVLFGFF
ncbi:hypothetical protein HanRHA438_Chr17g0806061 [Helianthus annuus]|nr:hypothetical protein HanRHA438_Chr17g0806061 [Helianthus annuus]